MKQILLIMIGLSISLFADFTRDDTTKIVTDNETGLQWQDNKTVYKTWQSAINYCEALTLGDYDDWRLPNINELLSIVDDTKINPSMSSVFKSFASSNYWSSTTNAYYSSNAWLVGFYYGYQDYNNKNNSIYVRCVRAGQ